MGLYPWNCAFCNETKYYCTLDIETDGPQSIQCESCKNEHCIEHESLFIQNGYNLSYTKYIIKSDECPNCNKNKFSSTD